MSESKFNAKYVDAKGKEFDCIVESSKWIQRGGSVEHGANQQATAATNLVAYNVRVAYPYDLKKNGPRHPELKAQEDLIDDLRPVHGVLERKDYRDPTNKAHVVISDEVRTALAPPPLPVADKKEGDYKEVKRPSSLGVNTLDITPKV